MDDKLKNLKKFAANFSKMLNEEKCNIFKVNYWNAMEGQIKKANLDNNVVIKFVFEEILLVNKEILKTKNLFFCIIEFLIEKNNETVFISYYYDYLNHSVQNYDENRMFFHDYLTDHSFNYLFDKLDIINSEQIVSLKMMEFFKSLIEYDLNLFDLTFRKKLDFHGLLSISDIINKKYTQDLFIFYLTKLNIEDISYYLDKLQNITITIENIKVLICLIDKLSNLIKIKSDKQNLENLIFTSIKILKLIYRTYSVQLNLSEEVEDFLILIIENIIKFKKLQPEYLIVLLKYYNLHKFKFFNKLFMVFTLYLSEDIYDSYTMNIIKEIIETCGSDLSTMNYVYSLILNKNFQINHGNKNYINNKHYYKNIIINNENDDIKLFTTLINQNFNICNLNLLVYIIESCTKYDKQSIIFNSHIFTNNLNTLLELNLEDYDIAYNSYILKFLFQFIYVIYENPNDINIDSIKLLFLKISKISNQQFLRNEIFPLVLHYLQNNIIGIIDKINMNLLDIFFNFLLSFSRYDPYTNIICKFIIGLYTTTSKKDYALSKYTELVIRANSGKVFNSYYNFIQDQIKSGVEDLLPIIYVNLYRYSSSYEGALNSSFLDFIYNKFEMLFDQLPNITFESLMIFNITYELIKKDEPEIIINKLYNAFQDKKFLKHIDKLLKHEAVYIKDQTDNSYENIINNKLYLNNQFIINENIIIVSKIFSKFVSNFINHNKSSFTIKNLSDTSNKIIQSTFQCFDFITNLIFQEINWNTSLSYFANEFFDNNENILFYVNTHSYFTAIENISKDEKLDLSYLNEINQKIISDKNSKFVKLLLNNSESIFILRKLFISLINYELNIIRLIDSEKKQTLNTNYVIDNLNTPLCLNNFILKNKSEKENFFIFEFLGFLYEKYEDTKNIHIFNFILKENTLITQLKSLSDYLHFDLFLINFYSIVRNKDDYIMLKNFLIFLNIFSKVNKNVFIFSLRILLNTSIFKKLYDKECLLELSTLTDFLINHLIFYNSYKNETHGYIIKILSNIESILDEDLCENLKYYGKSLQIIYNNIEGNIFKIEINKKFKEAIITSLNQIFINYVEKSLNINSYNIIKENYIAYFQNLDLLINFKNIRSYINNEKNQLYEIIINFAEISNVRYFHKFINDYLTIMGDFRVKDLIDNYLVYNFSNKNNSKLMFNMIKTILFYNNQSITFNQRVNFISMAIPCLINTEKNISNKIKILTNIGSSIHINIIKKLGIENALLGEINQDILKNYSEEILNYYNSIKN